jgi:hypothetical protein
LISWQEYGDHTNSKISDKALLGPVLSRASPHPMCDPRGPRQALALACPPHGHKRLKHFGPAVS